MRVLVCGGRDYSDLVAMVRAFRDIPDDTTLIHGGCRGADVLAAECAKVNGWNIEAYPVDHTVDGPWPGAGPRRNQRMLDASKPDMVIAFPGGRGTADMVKRARKAGVYVREV